MFDNDDPIQRQRLIQLLTTADLQARELNSGGGVMHVFVPLLDSRNHPFTITAQRPELQTYLKKILGTSPYETFLYIVTNSLRTNCEVGLMGVDGRSDSQVASDTWKQVNSLQDAVAMFQQFWKERDRWFDAFINGNLTV